jgi:hypothetical protein
MGGIPFKPWMGKRASRLNVVDVAYQHSIAPTQRARLRYVVARQLCGSVGRAGAWGHGRDGSVGHLIVYAHKEGRGYDVI